ncbi:hypothetical protein LHU53_18750 [Rhodoferax sp. U2-2l]|uniref:hypothetical protein n=1 Tax=Rhodoferax sp. U2-2l TaxID=2884000 RepID=UPI001D0BBFB8|nr:hypothetical protein [Rhodoferax sp. U2-2l]MCB8748934.1 hypothetical protein [Rhodoferax sp. U2-2l]
MTTKASSMTVTDDARRSVAGVTLAGGGSGAAEAVASAAQRLRFSLWSPPLMDRHRDYAFEFDRPRRHEPCKGSCIVRRREDSKNDCSGIEKPEGGKQLSLAWRRF